MEINNSDNQVSTRATEETFWSVLADNKCNIYIPRIQRDYAQGRTEPEPTQIRETFLDDIFRALETKEKLDINFIYGNIENNKFIPIDGQQRLTTLFLLHWYFAMYTNEMTDDVKSRLLQFQYETRYVTGQFCEHLVKDVNIDLKALIKNNKEIIPIIKDYYWFFSDFENDATIRSMLVMLEAIHSKVKECNENITKQFFSTLISKNAPIKFLFLNIDDMGLTDIIYIKMNARGKALTHFENFKAQLSKYLKIEPKFSHEFIKNINGEWSQFFWSKQYRKDDTIVFDEQVMKLFRFVMFNEYIVNVDISNISDMKNTMRAVLKELVSDSDFVFTNRLFKNGFRKVSAIETINANVDINAFKKINTLLNVFSYRKKTKGNLVFVDSTEYGKKYIDEDNAFIRMIRATDEKELNYEERVLLFAEYGFLVKYANSDYSFDKEIELNEWLRLIYNLTKYTLYNGWDDYFRSIRSIRKMLDNGYAENCLDYMATMLQRNYRQGSGFGFYEEQVIEECIKANFILNSVKWKSIIAEAEQSFLDGQIGSILAFSGIRQVYSNEMENFEITSPDEEKLPEITTVLSNQTDSSSYFEDFKLYLKKMQLIFDKSGIRKELEEQALLRRSLLCYGGNDSYMLPPGKDIQSFLDSFDRDYGFKRLLRDDNNGKRKIFKELLDDIDVNKNLGQQLSSVIDNMTYTDNNRWKKYFIEMPEILDCMGPNENRKDPSGKYIFGNPQRFISRHNCDEILILERTSTRSNNRELYSYVLYLMAIADNVKMDYHATFTESAEKYASYTDGQDDIVQVLYQKDESDDKYKYFAKKDGIVLFRGDLNQMMYYIKQNN